MKNPDPNEPEGEDPQAQQVDLEDADVSAEPSQLPPGLPPLPPQASLAPVPPSSMAPPMGLAPPAAPSRSPMFYVGVLVGVLLLSAAIGTVVALSRRHATTATTATAATPTGASSASSASGAPKVITIRTIEMDDNPDSGP
ncbi:MAG: hypothetical protein JWO86_4287 [Myxococcaceae bacterium]|nr:hypothetical protein [Myxococcaceae bacterium]MEA2746897.1 hypothetical protein [Myxococcales bacterium]